MSLRTTACEESEVPELGPVSQALRHEAGAPTNGTPNSLLMGPLVRDFSSGQGHTTSRGVRRYAAALEPERCARAPVGLVITSARPHRSMITHQRWAPPTQGSSCSGHCFETQRAMVRLIDDHSRFRHCHSSSMCASRGSGRRIRVGSVDCVFESWIIRRPAESCDRSAAAAKDGV